MPLVPRRSAATTIELQRALRLLGWPIRVDGALGEQTAEAVRDFQRGYAFSTLVANGGAGPRTRDALRTTIRRGGRCSPHFTFRDFRSPGSGSIKLDRALVRALEVYRAELGAPVVVLSGYRDRRWNRARGGLRRSHHLHGTAADVEPAMTVDEICALRVFSGIGVDAASGRVWHVDVRHCGPNPERASVARPVVFEL